MIRSRTWTRVALTALLLLPAACTDDTPTDPALLTFAPGLNVNLSAMTRTSSGLYIQDEVVGTGATAVRGSTVTVDYTGWLHNGTQFDTSSGRSPIEVVNIGSANVIAGWNEGLIGMRVGGRRLLVIPPRLAYGSEGRSPSIPAHATLVFRVDLRSVR
jgi:FKBP-type peptidyl-prolyl cis-trans isomerase FkpA